MLIKTGVGVVKSHTYSAAVRSCSQVAFEQQSPKHNSLIEGNRLGYLASRLQDTLQDKLSQSKRIKIRPINLKPSARLLPLSRGYSITTDIHNQVVDSADKRQSVIACKPLAPWTKQFQPSLR